ncbi:hypothetical protein HYW11_00925, partial [Candidatus Peregrinibacteria bacterium]|nr:hypothetical protein [Candidatus Peregrinibacteria bacterium]
LPILSSLLEDSTTQTIHPSDAVHRSAVIEGNVTIEEGARIFPHATVRGPCFIGKNTIIGNNAFLWGSSVGHSCVIGFGTEVKASILHNHVWTHSTYIGDSVIGDNVSFGAGGVVGNFRLDEGMISSFVGHDRIRTGLKKLGTMIGNDCRIGVHVSMNPGIKIGRGSFVSTAAVIAEDVPDGSFVSMKGGEMVIRKNTAPPPRPQDRLFFRGNVWRKSPVSA